ncbi:integrase [Rhodoligotrophos appendicifer]|uniref:tyrosine-type recombinase/integrase n=1 Tax=Rhodoligotrophos appendicifer TaxID=987056 RepID=UPI00118518FD|nr:tyrosine-type recombinase/integrase [Rhodoligotrophos appendicifer]
MIRLKYIHKFRDRHNEMRYYFRRNGIRTPLPGLPGSKEFMDAYAVALKDQPAPKVDPRPVVRPGTFSALAIRYFGSPQYRNLAVSSRINYKRVIDSFLVEHGHRLVSEMSREHVDIIVGKLASKPGAGIVLLKRLRTLVRYAVSLGWIGKDPTAGATSYRSTEIHTWSEEQIAHYERYWAIGTRERLAFALLLYTGQRGSDTHRMTWSDIAGDTIRVSQQKTGEKLEIPLHPELQIELGLAKRRHVTVLATEYGKPFTVKGFGNMISDAIREAGLPLQCRAHGLRKAAARRLAEAGCSANQIASITGHKTLAEVERYTRAADQKRLARQAIEKQTGTPSGKPTLAGVANHAGEGRK